MDRRQTSLPRHWFIADARSGSAPEILAAARQLPLGAGVLLIHSALPPAERQTLLRELRQVARSRKLTLIDEAHGGAVRVHNVRELTRARLRRAPLLLLSPVFRTRSHPDWPPLPRMRAATLLRLARAPVLALGGMNSKRYRAVERLGFRGWAGIDGWVRT